MSTFATTALLLVPSLALAVGCATPSPDSLAETEPLRRGARFRVESVVAESAPTAAVDGAELHRDAMVTALAEAGVLAVLP